MGNYQELIFYQKARQVVKQVDALVKNWPKTMQARKFPANCFVQLLPLAQISQKDMEDIKAPNIFTI